MKGYRMEIHRGKKFRVKINMTQLFDMEAVLDLARSFMRVDKRIIKIVLVKKKERVTLRRNKDAKMQST